MAAPAPLRARADAGMSGPRTTLPSMGLPSSPEHPQPLRVVAHAVRGYIDKLGPIWVEAQLIEINQGARSRLVFLTMRDTLAEVSVSVSISPLTFDAAGPLTKGQTVIARLKPSYYATTGRLTFACDSITPSGEGRLLARLEQTKRLLQAEGLFDPALKKRLPFLPRAVGLITGAAQRGRTRRGGERPASLAGGADRDPARSGARSAGRRADHRGAAAAGSAGRSRRHHPRPGRRIAGGSAAVLRRRAGPSGLRLPYAGGQRHRSRVGQPDPRSGRRRSGVDPHRRREAGGAGCG